jgi:membrane protease YdiL (CAAX protease family)
MALVTLRTGSLWFAIGLHGAWNFTLGPIASLPVSGYRFFPLLEVESVGSPLWTGGEYGLEGSLLSAAVSVAAVVVLLARRRRPVSAPA